MDGLEYYYAIKQMGLEGVSVKGSMVVAFCVWPSSLLLKNCDLDLSA